MTQIGRPSVWDQKADEMAALYEEGKSMNAIARQLGTTTQTVGRVLRKHGINVVPSTNAGIPRGPLSEAHKASISASRKGKGTGPRVARETRSCAACGQSFQYRPGQTGEIYCSRSCRDTGQAHALRDAARAEYAMAPRVCVCGTPIAYDNRHSRTFCSNECTRKYGKKRQPDPAKQITFNCGGCGKEVTRWAGYGGSTSGNRYCSNACSAKHTKKVRHYVVRECDMVLDSTWEMLFAGLMGFSKIPCERVDRAEAIEWSPGRWYAPDFHLPDMGLYVEVKGLEDDDDAGRWDAWPDPLVVVDERLLNELRTVGRGNYTRRLLRIATITKV